MAAKVNALIVTLEDDLSEEQSQHLIDAILCLKNVIGVAANKSSIDDIIALTRAKHMIGQRLYEALSK